MGGEPGRDFLPVFGKARLGRDRIGVAVRIVVADALEGIVELPDEGFAQLAGFRRLIGQHAGHIVSPVLVLVAVATHADRMRGAQHAGEISGIAEIVGSPRGKALRRACAPHEEEAKQEGMKTCLLHARTFARLRPRLKGLDAAVRFVTIDDAGKAHDGASGAELDDVPALDAAFGNADGFYSPAVREFMTAMLKAPALDWFQSAAAGIENPALVMIGQKAKRYTTNHTQAEAMAEWALWQALDFLRAGPVHRAQQAGGVWKRIAAREIRGSRWLVVGYGSIGQAAGRRVTALGGEVTGLRRSPGPAEGAARIVAPDRLHPELKRADIVLLCPPHTPETEGMANAAFFAAMAPHALFLNLGRGALVVEADLMAALDAGCPAWAAIDVTSAEPLPPDNPLWRHPKITITPHDSADTPGTIDGADDTFLANLERYLKGEPLKHEVDPANFRT